MARTGTAVDHARRAAARHPSRIETPCVEPIGTSMPPRKTLDSSEIVTHRGTRRAALHASLAVGGALTLVGTLPAYAEAQRGHCSDSDPYDPAGHGRHCGSPTCSDSDPYDPAGHGRHCAHPACSDHDPYDPAGHGRHC